MLTEFYFDSELFLDDHFCSKVAHENLMNMWSNYGCLFVCNEGRGQHLFDNVNAKFKTKWMTLFSDSRTVHVDFENPVVSEFKTISSLEGDLSSRGLGTVLIADGCQGKILGDEGYYLSSDKGVEVLIPDEINSSHNFSESVLYSKKDINKSDDINQVWSTRFRKLAMYSKVITVQDRYFIKNLVEDIEKGNKTSLELFIEFLSKDVRNKFSLSFYSSGNEKDGHDHKIVEGFLTRLSKKPYYHKTIASITITSCAGRFFPENAHERFLKFDNHVMALGNGMQLFRCFPLNVTSFSIKHSIFTHFDQSTSTFNKNRTWEKQVN